MPSLKKIWIVRHFPGNHLKLMLLANHVVVKCLRGLYAANQTCLSGIYMESVFRNSRNFSGLFRVSQFPLYLKKREDLRRQTSEVFSVLVIL